MTLLNVPPQISPDLLRRSDAPFLVWPVSRREFYMSIGVALLPPLAWGMVIFGWHVVGTVIVTLAAAAIVHLALKWSTARGKTTMLAHSLLSTMVMLSLCRPLWPGWIIALAGACLPIALWLLGGPGKERVHVAFLFILALEFLVVPWLQGHVEWGDGILARDRLFMGDIRNQKEGAMYTWPASVAIGGNDALRVDRPGKVALDTLDQFTGLLRSMPLPSPSYAVPGPPRQAAQKILDDAVSNRLPSMEMLVLGAVPGRIGAVSALAMIVGGLYLAYRYILRPRSVGLLLASYILTMAAIAISPSAITHLGAAGILRAWSAFPADLATLLSYAIFNSDLVFAAVFILALPGTEPLTGRGRRVFLVTAGILAAFLARLNWGLPTATLTLCCLMPFADQFDRLFAKRSWMNRLWS